MEIAQHLYEAGHITYMRTDSPNLSQEAIDSIRAYCKEKELPLSPKIRTWKAKEGAQEGHEAIRPTHIEVEKAGDNPEALALYELIRSRALASQLADAISSVRILRMKAKTGLDGKEVLFEARGSTLLSKGFKSLWKEDDEEKEPMNPVPELKEGMPVKAESGRVLTKKTVPPPRYTEASLIHDLENMGIGRPSTFASIISLLFNRQYVELQQNKMVPTPMGFLVVEKLMGSFSFIDYEFTKNMECKLDDITLGVATYKEVVKGFYESLQEELEKFSGSNTYSSGNRNEVACDIKCPECSEAILKHFVQVDKYNFFKCPACGSSFPCVDGKPGAKKQPAKLSEYKCPECGKALIRRQGQKKDGSGTYDFYGCSGFPKCNAKYNTNDDGTPHLVKKDGTKKDSKTVPNNAKKSTRRKK
jgi:DNA topoisomerase-1